jgi:hypothetical protein
MFQVSLSPLSSLALAAAVGLALAFALSDGIEVDGACGELKAIGTRAIHLATADDTEVIIPHSMHDRSSAIGAASATARLEISRLAPTRADR